MNIFRKTALLALCAALSLPLAACAGGGEKEPAGTSGAVTSDASAEITETETTTEEEIIFSEEEMNGKNVYRVKRVEKKADIDWNSVPAAAIDSYGWVECTEYKAYAQLVFAEDFGFVCRMTCEEDSPAATYTKFDDPVCLDSCMEFFVCFSGNSYLNLEANSIGTKCMGYGPSRESRKSIRYRLPGGFDAMPEVSDGVWTMTYELSMENIQIFYPDVTVETFAPGYEFSGNFYKTGGQEITGNEHYGMWNEVRTENPDFHQPSQFGIFIME